MLAKKHWLQIAGLAVLVLCWVSSAGAVIQWDYESPLTVVEDITDLGAGEYRYEYSFTNVDASPVFVFGVYLTFEARGEHTFTTHAEWRDPFFRYLERVSSVYDASNLDESIIGFVWSDSCKNLAVGVVCPAENMILVAEYAAGVSFTASVYDPSPKFYFYSTVDSGRPDYTERFAAVGTTVPEPMSMLLLSFDGLALLRTRGAFGDF